MGTMQSQNETHNLNVESKQGEKSTKWNQNLDGRNLVLNFDGRYLLVNFGKERISNWIFFLVIQRATFSEKF